MQRFFRILIVILLSLPASAIAAGSPADLFTSDRGDLSSIKKNPVYFEANQIAYDQEIAVITARGNVQINQGQRYVTADQISYNEKDGRLTASGNIVIKDQGGETVYADFIELTDEFKNGVITNMRLRLNDNSRIAAQHADRVQGQYKNMDYATFSPCLPCAKDPSRAPLWQIKARKVVHDEQAQEIQYTDPRLELWGTPVFYSPYLSHPDPELKRRSGVLAPSFKNSDELGFVYSQPYYYTFSPSQDITLEPAIMTKDGFILRSDYRQRLDDGRIEIKSSIADVDRRTDNVEQGKTIRGHINGRMALDLDDNWRSNVQLDRVTDKTYLRRYNISSDDVLISKAETEGFFDRSYAQFRAMSFQGLRDFDKSRTTPLVLPQLRYNYASDFDNMGGLWQVDSEILNLQRQTGGDSHRASLDAQWHKPMRTEGGQLFDLILRTQGSGYFVENYDDPTSAIGANADGWQGRVVPQANLAWRYPLSGRIEIDTGSSKEQLSKYIEPMVSLVTSPNVGKNNKIPNEDSQAFEFDESNLFSLKRFPGYDRIAGGNRIDYGLNMGLFDDHSRGGKIFVGQSWRPREDSTYAVGSGLEDKFSDIVGKIELNPSELVDLIYRFRADPDKPALRRSEISAVTHTGPLKLGLDYIFLDRLVGNQEFNDREQLGVRASYQMTDNWNLSGRILSDINSSHSTREWATGLTYHDECVSSGFSIERQFISDSENKPGTSFIFRIDLKHLGGEIKEDYFTPRRANSYTGTLLPQY